MRRIFSLQSVYRVRAQSVRESHRYYALGSLITSRWSDVLVLTIALLELLLLSFLI